jgi:hypothetical protein
VTTFDLFRVAEQIELAAAELYRTLASQFADDAAARDLFTRLEGEEIQHAARVRLLASQYRVDRKLIGNVAGAALLRQCEFQAQAALAEIRAGAWGRDLRSIMVRLAMLEGALSTAHAEALAHEADPALREFFRRLSEQDAAHRDLLRRP